MADRLLGSFVWCELMTTDTAAAESFYKKVTGWTSMPFGPDGSYTVFNNAAGAGVGGVMKLPDAREADGRAAALADVRRHAQRRRDRRAYRAAWRARAETARRHSQHWPLRRRPGSIRGDVRHLPAPAEQARQIRSSPASATSRGSSSTRRILRAPGSSTRRCLAGKRRPRWTWARWACTRCSGAAVAFRTAGS